MTIQQDDTDERDSLREILYGVHGDQLTLIDEAEGGDEFKASRAPADTRTHFQYHPTTPLPTRPPGHQLPQLPPPEHKFQALSLVVQFLAHFGFLNSDAVLSDDVKKIKARAVKR